MTVKVGATGDMRVLFVSNLYPNPREPARGIFNRHTVRALAEQVEVRVLAAVPWFPGSKSMTGIPERLDDDGVQVRYVRAFYTPLVLRNLHGKFFRSSIRRTVLDIRGEFPFDVLYGSWVYPDGYGVTLLARELGVPCVLHALGSDIHRYLDHPRRRRKVLEALSRADHVVCVSRYLRDRVVEAGLEADRITVVYDGVDTELFGPRDRREARARLGLPQDSRIILFVGSLRPIKGPEHMVEAFRKLKCSTGENLHLAIVGDGPLGESLREEVRELGLADSVTFAGTRLHGEVPEWMSAADVLCLSSLDEGMPNVVLEALASGRPVVATNVGGVGEVINSESVGLLVQPGDPEALAAGLREALRRKWDTGKLVARAGEFTWQEHGRRIGEVLRAVTADRGSARTPDGGPLKGRT